jgi:hypothetical protein
MKNLIVSLSCFGLVLACGGQGALDVGDETGKTGQALSDYAASWDGYAEAFAFPGDGKDRVRLTLDENGAGVLRVGDEALFPPAAEPDGLYPPTFALTGQPDGSLARSLRGLRSGFEFAISGASVSGARLKFRVDVGQIMDSWCALQTAEPVPGFSCGDGGGYGYSAEFGCFVASGSEEADGVAELDCDVAQQCDACLCEGDGCRAVSREWNSLEIDGALTDGGDTFEGTLVTADHERIALRMLR